VTGDASDKKKLVVLLLVLTNEMLVQTDKETRLALEFMVRLNITPEHWVVRFLGENYFHLNLSLNTFNTVEFGA